MIKAGMWIGRVDKIFITHLHGDHCYDIVGLLALRGMRKILSPVEVVGPVGIKELIETTARLSRLYLPFKLSVRELEPERVHELGWRSHNLHPSFASGSSSSASNDDDMESNEPFSSTTGDSVASSSLQTSPDAQEVEAEQHWNIVAYPLDHRIDCFGYVFSEKMQQGAFDSALAISKGVNGKDIGKLAQSDSVVLADGTIVKRIDCLKHPFPGRKLVILGDTHTCNEALHEGAKHAGVFVHETTFEQSLADLALKSKHSTTHMAADCAIKSKAKTLIITHFSARYMDHGGVKTVDDLLAESTQHAGGKVQVLAAKDLWTVEVPPKKAPLVPKS